MAAVLWLCGPSGVGKSTVGWALFSRFNRVGVKTGYVDFDQIGFCRPSPTDDSENHRLKAANLAVLLPNFRAAGAHRMVVSGIVETPEVIRTYADAVPETRLILCRLTVGHDELRERIFLRGRGGGAPIPGDELVGQPGEWLFQAAEHSNIEADAMERYGLGDFCVATDGRTVPEVVELVLAAAGDWPDLDWLVSASLRSRATDPA